MTPIEWLEQNASGFRDLSIRERESIMHFALLWSLFETAILDKGTRAPKILENAELWRDEGRLLRLEFDKELAYFKNRYFQDGHFTEYFHQLRLRHNGMPGLVRAVLRGERTDDASTVAALLIIVLRFRNNLFHGLKWVDDIRGQQANFDHANSFVMKVFDIVSAPA